MLPPVDQEGQPVEEEATSGVGARSRFDLLRDSETELPQDSEPEQPQASETEPPQEPTVTPQETETAEPPAGDDTLFPLADAGEYYVGLYAGHPNYGCPYCSYATLEGPGAVELHILGMVDKGPSHARALELKKEE